MAYLRLDLFSLIIYNNWKPCKQFIDCIRLRLSACFSQLCNINGIMYGRCLAWNICSPNLIVSLFSMENITLIFLYFYKLLFRESLIEFAFWVYLMAEIKPVPMGLHRRLDYKVNGWFDLWRNWHIERMEEREKSQIC